MSSLHLFNPSHDEALAAHSPYYYPARAARILERDLALLPTWWAQPGDKVLLPEEVAFPPANFQDREVDYVHLSEVKHWGDTIDRICPWGWDALLVRRLRQAGLPPHLLPSDTQLESIRQLSSRATAIQLLQAVRTDIPTTVGISAWCTTADEVWQQVEVYRRAMLKAPWSSSGRGVFSATSEAGESLRQRVNKILSLQGGIEVEPLYDRLTDFAVEFEATPTAVHYLGLSVFDTTDNGAYTGNIIGSETLLYATLPPAIQTQLPEVIDRLSHRLPQLLQGNYVGPLGIDMMCVKGQQGEILLHPCIEINLRRTMGHVALALREQLSPGQQAIYRIHPVNRTMEALRLTPGALQMEAILIRD